ncbi:ABC transporter ATP-binding protein [Jiangella alba]|uniref:Peptide/nickel transport system ATP-binding protein n=1 Tax=Jiangella alba TaxID=561176 RepID=A0A1H5Q0C3_9ACTN|nr:ABC transporter ATP-binding protein [Jiangella alba]SEF18888.1 peptide/nickel transport system ATP-binding protein [Jiangella alba]
MSETTTTLDPPAVDVRAVRVDYGTARGLSALLRDRTITAVEDVSFAVRPGEIVGIGGESGCGKSTVAGALCGLVRVASGRIEVAGREVTRLSHPQWRTVRPDIQLVFQDPFDSLNPQFSIFATVAEPLVSMKLCRKDEIAGRVVDALERAELTPPERYLSRRPASLSGGERQRVSIARALVVRPRVLVADEPVSMLDPTTAVGITSLLRRLADDLGMAVVLISHDLKLLASVCDTVGIMYLGRLVEFGPAADVLGRPVHPYTRLLLAAVPNLDPRTRRPRVVLTGAPPSPALRPAGCPFHPRCPLADGTDCTAGAPALAGAAHQVACHHATTTPTERTTA